MSSGEENLDLFSGAHDEPEDVGLGSDAEDAPHSGSDAPPGGPEEADDGEDEGAPRIWTVSELNSAVRFLLEDTLPPLWVGGEVANWTRARSGHCYFSLRDERAQLRCVLFRRDAQQLPLEPEDGIRIQAHGTLTLYEARGDFQLVVRKIRGEEGEGLWRLAFERLRKKLEGEGLLSRERKRPIPRFPETVGVVTSPSGAAFRDMASVLGRRAPWTRVLLRGSRVQGEGAAQEVAEAIRVLSRSGRADVIIVGRGGGSTEDLWAFNEEPVARAIADSPVPVISAVGHETDVTISDLVADLRAPTPSAAAEAAVQDGAAIAELLRELQPRLARGLSTLSRERRRRLAEARRALARCGPGLVEPRSRTVSQQRDRLERGVAQLLQRAGERVSLAAGRLEGLSPLGTIRRGYAVPRDSTGRILHSVKELEVDDPFEILMSDGRVRCVAKDVSEEAWWDDG